MKGVQVTLMKEGRTMNAEVLAGQIADELFASGGGEQAQRLVLTVDYPAHRELGGWNKEAATRQIARMLHQEWKQWSQR